MVMPYSKMKITTVFSVATLKFPDINCISRF